MHALDNNIHLRYALGLNPMANAFSSVMIRAAEAPSVYNQTIQAEKKGLKQQSRLPINRGTGKNVLQVTACIQKIHSYQK